MAIWKDGKISIEIASLSKITRSTSCVCERTFMAEKSFITLVPNHVKVLADVEDGWRIQIVLGSSHWSFHSYYLLLQFPGCNVTNFFLLVASQRHVSQLHIKLTVEVNLNIFFSINWNVFWERRYGKREKWPAIKLYFCVAEVAEKQTKVFVPVEFFQASLIFVSKVLLLCSQL